MNKREIANAAVKESLLAGLYALLRDKKLSEIGISELIAEAGVARSSFYRNFNSLEEILDYQLAELVAAYRSECPVSVVDYSDVEYMTWKFSFYQRFRHQILILKDAGLASMLLATVNDITREGAAVDPDDPLADTRLYFGAGAFHNVVMHWLEAGAPTTPRELATVFCEQYARGALAPVSR